MNYRADSVYKNLFIGPWPPFGDALAQAGIDTLVLCAKENCDPSQYEGLEVICAAGDDDGRPHRMLKFVDEWTRAAATVADHVRQGKKVLVTCIAGHNRSGFVTAVALHYLTGMSGEQCVQHIQNRRPDSLNNDTFVKYIEETFL